MTELVISSLAFVLIHLVPALPHRATIVNRIGRGAYIGLFSILSLALLVWMVTAYFALTPGAPLWVAGIGLRHGLATLMLIAFALVVMGVMAPNPALTGASATLDGVNPPTGVLAITRHPMNAGIALWAVSHLIARPEGPALIFFGAFLLMALTGGALQDRRKAAEFGERWGAFERTTSVIPFAAVISGRARLRFGRTDAIGFVVAFVLWGAMLHLHGWIIGVPIGLF